MKPVQFFSDEYLEQCSKMNHAEIAKFLDDYRKIHGGRSSKSKLISIKIPEDMFESFKTKAKLNCIPYPPLIKRLMRDWLCSSK